MNEAHRSGLSGLCRGVQQRPETVYYGEDTSHSSEQATCLGGQLCVFVGGKKVK